jgi:type IV secretory pathway protease TraF
MWFRRPLLSPGLRHLAVVALGLVGSWATCFRLNLSPSLPAGVYFLVPASLSWPFEHGDLALVCPPSFIATVARARGYAGFGLCPGFVPELLKPIGGLPGDRLPSKTTSSR